MSQNKPYYDAFPNRNRAPSRKLTRRTRRLLFLGACILISVVLVLSCGGEPEKRTFSEVKKFDSPILATQITVSDSYRSPAPEVAPEAATPVHGSTSQGGALRWEAPEGWKVYGGSGMYAGVFKTSGKEDADEGSIIALPGEAGGLLANTELWLGQIGLALSPEKIGEFVNRAERIQARGGFEVVFLDFNPLVNDPSDNGMLVAVAKPGNDSYFIKLVAPKSDLERHRKNFVRFCESLEIGS